MNTIDVKLCIKAFEAGYEARKTGKSRAPAMSQAYRDLVVGFKIGEGANELADEFLAGFDECTYDELADRFSDDEYFQKAAIQTKQHRETRHSLKFGD